jgi:hypothetical protein
MLELGGTFVPTGHSPNLNSDAPLVLVIQVPPLATGPKRLLAQQWHAWYSAHAADRRNLRPTPVLN